MLSLALLLAVAHPGDPAPAVAPGPVVTTPSGLRFLTLKPGSGPKPTTTDAVLVTYEGHLADGTLFDASAQPVGFGVSDLIPGFTEALLMMEKGGRYRFWIPGHLAYGEAGAGGGAIPPNAELDFIVTLIDIAPAQAAAAGQPEQAPQPEQ
jgi:FKBP-type peptidyl-prolyl cis-trans isomerase FkpA